MYTFDRIRKGIAEAKADESVFHMPGTEAAMRSPGSCPAQRDSQRIPVPCPMPRICLRENERGREIPGRRIVKDL